MHITDPIADMLTRIRNAILLYQMASILLHHYQNLLQTFHNLLYSSLHLQIQTLLC